MAKINIDVPGYVSKMRGRAIASLEDAGFFLANKIRENISDQGPPHSSPGEYPKSITGELRDSAFVSVDEINMRVTVEMKADHAIHVENIRPFVSRTFEENADEVEKIIKAGL